MIEQNNINRNHARIKFCRQILQLAAGNARIASISVLVMNRILWSTIVFAVDGGLQISTPHTKWNIFLYIYFCMFIFTYMFETSIAGTLMGNPSIPVSSTAMLLSASGNWDVIGE